jgi:hypothetical protein
MDKVLRGSIYKTTDKVGSDFENTLKNILKEEGFTIVEEINDSRPTDIFAWIKIHPQMRFRLGLIIEAKDTSTTKYIVSPYGNILKIAGNKRYNFDYGEILGSLQKCWNYVKTKGNEFSYGISMKILFVTTGEISGSPINSNRKLMKDEIYLIEYNRFHEWLRYFKRLFDVKPPLKDIYLEM